MRVSEEQVRRWLATPEVRSNWSDLTTSIARWALERDRAARDAEAKLAAVEEVVAGWEYHALRWANPLTVPPEVAQIRAALGGDEEQPCGNGPGCWHHRAPEGATP